MLLRGGDGSYLSALGPKEQIRRSMIAVYLQFLVRDKYFSASESRMQA